jgi:hypothetical protein
MKKRPLPLVWVTLCISPLAPCVTPAEEVNTMAKALTFHASFERGLDADFSKGENGARYRFKDAFVPAEFNQELQHQPQGGRFGGAVVFPKKGNSRPQYRAGDLLNYNGTDWSATVSIWLKLDPDKDLEPGFCDPVQIVGDDAKKGFIFLEWSKSETPRLFRFAIRPLFHLWNPGGKSWEEIPFDKRPMVQVANAPFSRDAWTHVVFSFEHINSKGAKPNGRLHLNGRKVGVIEGWDLTFGWSHSHVELVLGASYVGAMDELAVFNKSLSDAEISALHSLPNGIRDLYPAGR